MLFFFSPNGSPPLDYSEPRQRRKTTSSVAEEFLRVTASSTGTTSLPLGSPSHAKRTGPETDHRSAENDEPHEAVEVPKSGDANKTEPVQGSSIPRQEKEAKNESRDEDERPKEEPIAPFDEWTKQKLEEQQSRKQQTPNKSATAATAERKTSGGGSDAEQRTGEEASSGAGVAQRNYASRECGAKILETNPETQHSNAVLNGEHP